MPRYACMLANGLSQLGHDVTLWSPRAFFYKIPFPKSQKKWLGYIDQYIIFPQSVKSRIKSIDKNTLFVFSDHALGPWIPLVAHFPHVVHCHDFMAQHSAKKMIPENPTSFSGRIYQNYIYKGYSKGRHFISVSKKSQYDLHQLIGQIPETSLVVYNSINPAINLEKVLDDNCNFLTNMNLSFDDGFILHVGGNQWYKNRKGVILIYNEWRKLYNVNLPLLLVGSKPNHELIILCETSNFKESIHFLSDVEDKVLFKLYTKASVLLFPSLGEGFGWPIVESMALSTPVITTDEAPMNEVGGDAAVYIPRLKDGENIFIWTKKGADAINKILSFEIEELEAIKKRGVENSKRFLLENQMAQFNRIYLEILSKYNKV